MFIMIPPRTHKAYNIIVHHKYFKRIPLLTTIVCIDTNNEPMRFRSKQELTRHIKNIVMNRYSEYNYNACNIVITE